MPTASYYIGYTFPGGACRNPKTKSNWNASMGFAGTMLGVNKRVSIPPPIESAGSCYQMRLVVFLAASLAVRTASLSVPSIQNGSVNTGDPRT
jgi:hypothetical protein